MDASDSTTARIALLSASGRSGLFGAIRAPRLLEQAFDAVVRTALPPVCVGCGASGSWLCPICGQGTKRIALDQVCPRCGGQRERANACHRCAGWSRALTACRSAYIFGGVVREMIHRLKYQGEFARSEWCGLELAHLLVETGWKPDLIAPVPLHRSRLRSRGYNQSAKIAAVTAQALGVPWGDIVIRARATVSQVGLDAEQRRENVAGAFVCPHDLRDLSILLIDDVVTTGSTLDASAEACRMAAARDVRAVTLATGWT